MITIIVIYLLSSKGSFLRSIKEALKKNVSFAFLFLAGSLYTLNCIYLATTNQNVADIKLLFATSNPLIILIYTLGLIYLLSNRQKYSHYLLDSSE